MKLMWRDLEAEASSERLILQYLAGSTCIIRLRAAHHWLEVLLSTAIRYSSFSLAIQSDSSKLGSPQHHATLQTIVGTQNNKVFTFDKGSERRREGEGDQNLHEFLRLLNCFYLQERLSWGNQAFFIPTKEKFSFLLIVVQLLHLCLRVEVLKNCLQISLLRCKDAYLVVKEGQATQCFNVHQFSLSFVTVKAIQQASSLPLHNTIKFW